MSACMWTVLCKRRSESKVTGGEACYTDGVRMQHGEEVGAAQELGAG